MDFLTDCFAITFCLCFGQNVIHVQENDEKKLGLRSVLAFSSSLALGIWEHGINPEGVAPFLHAFVVQLSHIWQRIESAAEVCFPCLWVWLVYARFVPAFGAWEETLTMKTDL